MLYQLSKIIYNFSLVEIIDSMLCFTIKHINLKNAFYNKQKNTKSALGNKQIWLETLVFIQDFNREHFVIY